MDVILFTDNSTYDRNANLSLPIRMAGPFRIASELRSHNISCQIVDFIWSFNIDEIENICKKFISTDTKVIGFSATFWWQDLFKGETKNKKIVDTIIEIARRINPTCKIICGGANSGALEDIFPFDTIFQGYSESNLLQWINGSVDKKIIKQDPHTENFDFTKSSIKYIPQDLINYGDTLTIEISRGCIFKCKFCAYPLNGKKKLDYIKDMNILKDELIENYNLFGTTNYIFNDDTFNDSTEKLIQLDRMFSSLPFRIKFSAYLRLDLINRYPDQIKILKNMGLGGAFFGIESFNDASAKSIGKGLSGNTSKRLIEELKNIHWKNDVLITVGLIVGLPHETIENIQETQGWICESSVDAVAVEALHIVNSKKRAWLSEFDINHEKYGYTVSEDSRFWTYNNGPINSFTEAQKYANQLTKTSEQVYKDRAYSSFSVFLWPNLLRYSNHSYSLDQIIAMSHKERAELRHSLWQHCVGLNFANSYKRRLNIIDNAGVA